MFLRPQLIKNLGMKGKKNSFRAGPETDLLLTKRVAITLCRGHSDAAK